MSAASTGQLSDALDPQARLFALDPTSHGFGFVVLEGPSNVVDWGLAYVKPNTHVKCLERIAELLAWYVPAVVVVEDWRSKGFRRSARVRKLLQAVVQFTEAADARAERIPKGHVQHTFAEFQATTKEQIASAIALRFPELAVRKPPPRKTWSSEDERMAIFDAMALALTLFNSTGD